MPITCPACNKANQSTTVCQRCACELSQLQRVEAAATERLLAARAALAERDWAAALGRAERSWRLRNGPESARVAVLAALGTGDTERALRWRRRAGEAETAAGR